MATDLSVDVQVASAASSVPADEDIRTWIAAVLSQLDFTDKVEVSVRVVDVDESRYLNKTYREKDIPTNVLSFPAGMGDYAPDDVRRPLGDIVVCAPVVEAEATSRGKAPVDHWAHLVVHGTLHLLGFDHQNNAEAAEMEAIERAVLGTQGIADPYTA
jgi:probable rRNA maturation factor